MDQRSFQLSASKPSPFQGEGWVGVERPASVCLRMHPTDRDDGHMGDSHTKSCQRSLSAFSSCGPTPDDGAAALVGLQLTDQTLERVIVANPDEGVLPRPPLVMQEGLSLRRGGRLIAGGEGQGSAERPFDELNEAGDVTVGLTGENDVDVVRRGHHQEQLEGPKRRDPGQVPDDEAPLGLGEPGRRPLEALAGRGGASDGLRDRRCGSAAMAVDPTSPPGGQPRAVGGPGQDADHLPSVAALRRAELPPPDPIQGPRRLQPGLHWSTVGRGVIMHGSVR